ncbi:uncharacterized protein LOC122650747 [Telopea speciosissima]|uniref:uncharacterized protein LOC122650747 n=1 Tax=Telopea speciosissima TaxID=54955 RepID=UPI001CC65F3E|nr:uncharacterized protein LOC122650747 [Telopea speciosissima]
MVRKQLLDNRWVVLYNLYLLTRYDCHINVEICSGLKAVKYLYKYVYKRHDRVVVFVSHNTEKYLMDEIKHYRDAKWVSAQEAMWRIIEFNLNEMFPYVINLQLHLPNKQMTWHWKNQNLKNVVQSDNTSRTMLTEFFRINSIFSETRKYLYREFPEHYVWNNQVNSNKSDIFFIDGLGGTGKTYVYRALLATIRSNNEIALATATSRVAAAITEILSHLEVMLGYSEEISDSEFLLQVGNEKEPTEAEDLIKIPDKMVITMKNEGDGEDQLINEIFNELQHHGHSAKYITAKAILTTKNEIVDKLNEKLINLFPRESVTYCSFDLATDDADTQYPEEFLNSLAPNGLLPHKLILKKNCPVMLLRNLNPT